MIKARNFIFISLTYQGLSVFILKLSPKYWKPDANLLKHITKYVDYIVWKQAGIGRFWKVLYNGVDQVQCW